MTLMPRRFLQRQPAPIRLCFIKIELDFVRKSIGISQRCIYLGRGDIELSGHRLGGHALADPINNPVNRESGTLR